MYSRLFNFTNLENGVYKLVTTTGHKVVTNEIQVNESEIKLNKTEVEFQPVYRLEDKLLKIDFLNTDAHEVRLTISENKIANYTGINAYDVIPLEGTLMLTAKDGIYQYDYSNLENIRLLSKIAITNKQDNFLLFE